MSHHVPTRVDCSTTDAARLARLGPCRAWVDAAQMVRLNGSACLGCIRMPFAAEAGQ